MMVDGRFVVSGTTGRRARRARAALLGCLFSGLCACSFKVPAREASCWDDLCPAPDLAMDLALAEPDLAAPVLPSMNGGRGVMITDLEVQVGAAADQRVAVTLAGPSEDGAALSSRGAPFPLVLLAPGSTVHRRGYLGYALRLASHGFVAVIASPRSEEDQQQYRDDSRRLIEWLIAPGGDGASRFGGRIDRDRIGLWGHSLGGKMMLLYAASSIGPRPKAVLAADAVDVVGMRDPVYAADVLMHIRLPEGVPLGLLGQTTSRGPSVCMPGADNETLFMRARSPAFLITLTGAAHTDFIDDEGRCGSLCSLCPGGSAPGQRTRSLAMKYTTAYFLLALHGIRDMQIYLFGEEFQKDAAEGAVTRKVK